VNLQFFFLIKLKLSTITPNIQIILYY